MMKSFKNLKLLAISVLIIPFLLTSSRANAVNISVGLATGQNSVSISASSMSIQGSSGNKLVCRGRAIFSKRDARHLSVNNRVLVLPVKITSSSVLTFNNRKYRGSLRLVGASRGMNLVNILDIENYLRGVLKMEVNPGWPMESLKSQAIISRTYAYKHRGRHSSDGFDVCALPHCQVYRGINAEDSILDRAIKHTEGMVLKYGNNVASTFFHSDSGGATADVSKVWSARIPYLKGVKEPYNYTSPYSNWQTGLNSAEIARVMSKMGHNVGSVTAVSVCETDPYGRVNKILVKGSMGQAIVKAHSFRMAVGGNKLKSTRFTIGNVNTGSAATGKTAAPKQIDTKSLPAPELSFIDTASSALSQKEDELMTVLIKQGYFSSKEMIDMILDPGKKKQYLLKALNRPAPQKADNRVSASTSVSYATPDSKGNFRFTGSGWGHGVGLSQWGAKSLADRGWSSRKILDHYFPGTKLVKIY